ncbi:MAG: hypothetical protein B7Z15_10150 [Rhizobiales bacterium 32-66-8]|nr:MAG: hypothetical protein B7Z15_10150 [Rhizobiales bacterium 32-66-8]
MSPQNAAIPPLSPASAKLLYDGYQFQLRGLYEDAARLYRKILKTTPDNPDVLHLLAMVRARQARAEEAIELYKSALARKGNDAKIWYNFSLAVGGLQRSEEASDAMERALTLDPNLAEGPQYLSSFRRDTCDWRHYDALMDAARRTALMPNATAAPFFSLWFDEPELHAEVGRRAMAKKAAGVAPIYQHDPATRRPGPIRLAYLSSDFRGHPVGHLITQLLEEHDRTQFEVTAISSGPDDGGELRKRIIGAVDRFEDCQNDLGPQVAARIKALDIDILVDLSGHTSGARIEALAQRPAPIQVNYLGYAATTAAPFMDYIIADEVVLPFSEERFYREQIVHLPDTYLPCDASLPVAATPTRAACGLPETGLVFCAFNTVHKFDPHMFALWMRLLKATPGSVLWLRVGNERARTQTLPQAAIANGVDPARLVFAPLVPMDEHLARLRNADLFLDTFPYNAHTTAADALRSGLPLVTQAGRSFVSRVAASLLMQAGLDDLVTTSAEEYEALALSLATDPDRLAAVRARLAQALPTMPLLDAPRYRRHIEAAYTTMMERWTQGLPPVAFSVSPLPR